jgi:hypothetical protein
MSQLGQNPWFSILKEPKKTIRRIVDFNPNHRLLILSIIYGFCVLLGFAQQLKLGEKMSLISIIASAIIFSPIIGYIFFSFSSWLIYYTGKLIKGAASFKQIRAAIAWSNVPVVVNLLGWIVLILIFKKMIFEDFSKEILSSAKLSVFFAVVFVQMIASVWGIVIYVNALSEVQGFSILYAILNILFGIVAVFLIFFLISLLFTWTGIAFAEPLVSLKFF